MDAWTHGRRDGTVPSEWWMTGWAPLLLLHRIPHPRPSEERVGRRALKATDRNSRTPRRKWNVGNPGQPATVLYCTVTSDPTPQASAPPNRPPGQISCKLQKGPENGTRKKATSLRSLCLTPDFMPTLLARLRPLPQLACASFPRHLPVTARTTTRALTMPSTMQAANRLQTALNEGKGAAMGCWQMIPGANVSRTLARSGVDWVLVDCEHGNIDGKSRPPFGHPAPARGWTLFWPSLLASPARQLLQFPQHSLTACQMPRCTRPCPQ